MEKLVRRLPAEWALSASVGQAVVPFQIVSPLGIESPRESELA